MTLIDEERLPPLFLRLRFDGRLATSSLVDLATLDETRAAELVGFAAKEAYCEVVAPNGARAHGAVRLGADARSLRKQVLGLMAGSCSLAELWIDAGDTSEPTDDLKRVEVGLVAWVDQASALGQEDAEIVLARRSGRVDEYRIGRVQEPRFLQFWTEPGPSVVSSIAPGTTFTTALAEDRARQPYRLMSLPKRTDAAAYWGFTRHGTSEASESIAKSLLGRFEMTRGLGVVGDGLSLDDLLVVAHYLVRSSPDRDRRSAVRSALLAHDATDAVIARFVLGFDDERLPLSDLEADFWAVLARLPADPPTSTEIFRLFFERYSSALGMLKTTAGYNKAMVDRSQLHQLAAATYWDAQYLTYRALAPGRPDVNARGRDVETGLKKKAWLPHSSAGRSGAASDRPG